jgi:hypothetical protein
MTMGSFSSDELVRRAVAVARERKSPVLLITTRDLPDPPAGTTRTQLFKGEPCVVGDETFTVYRVEAP